jgi:hypothetical protein
VEWAAYRRRETRRAVRRPVRRATLRVLNMSCLLDVVRAVSSCLPRRSRGRAAARPLRR